MWQNIFKPEYLNWRRALCVSVGIYIHLFITFCEPYKGDKVTYIWDSTQAYIYHSLYNFAHVTFFCALTILILPKYFPKFFLPENFTLKKFLFLVTVTPLFIGFGFLFGNQHFFHHDITLSWFIVFFFKITVTNMLFVGLPFIVIFLLIFNYVTKQNNQEQKAPVHSFDVPPTVISEKATHELPEVPPQYFPELAAMEYPKTVMPHQSNPELASMEQPKTAIPHQSNSELTPVIVRFTDNSNRKTLNIPLDNLYYITSAQNYIEIFHQTNDAVPTRSLLRNSLKTIEEEMILSSDSPLIRCHKAYIVNREKVVEMRGTAKNAYFILADIEPTIPISRHKYSELEPYFPNFS